MMRAWAGELRDWVRRRTAWGLLAALWLMFFYDIGARVFVPRDATLRKFDAPAVPKVRGPTDAAAVEAALKTWFPPAEVPKALQRKNLALQGVLGVKGMRKAVLLVLSPEGVFESRRVVALGEELEGWKLTEIERASVTLVRVEDGQQEIKTLKMFPARAGGAP